MSKEVNSQMFQPNDKYLVTTSQWFFGPDGHQYRAAYGPVEIIKTSEGLGFNPSRSTNWFLRVGKGDGEIIIGGCQINYAVKLNQEPILLDGEYVEEGTTKISPLNHIYIPGKRKDNGRSNFSINE